MAISQKLHVPVSVQYRKKIQGVLSKHHLPYQTSILIKKGGLGDFIQLTAVAKALKNKEPERPIVTVAGKYCSLFAKHPYIDLAIEDNLPNLQQSVKSLVGLVENVFDLRYVSRAYGTWQNAKYFYENQGHYDFFPWSILRLEELNKHVCDLMLYSLGLEQFADCNDVLIIPDPVPEEIPGEYVVVCNSPNSSLGELKRWTVQDWNSLINWLLLKGIKPVQLGIETDLLLHPRVIDLRGKTTPRQAAGYLKLSQGYVGIEGGLFHLAKAVGTPAVVIFSTTPAISYAYPDTLVVTKRLCKPCLGNVLGHKQKCKYGHQTCLNLPPWKDVALEVSKMLNKQTTRTP